MAESYHLFDSDGKQIGKAFSDRSDAVDKMMEISERTGVRPSVVRSDQEEKAESAKQGRATPGKPGSKTRPKRKAPKT